MSGCVSPPRRYRSGERLDGPAMILSMSFSPKEPGFEQFGPFELPIGERTLVSNTIEVQVFPDWEPGEVGFRWQLSDEEVRVGQAFGLTVRQRVVGEKPETQYLQLAQRYRRSDAPLQITGGGSNSSSGSLNDERFRTTRQTFTITPTQPGEVHLTRELFENLPEDVEIPELIVDVLEQMPD